LRQLPQLVGKLVPSHGKYVTTLFRSYQSPGLGPPIDMPSVR
jgi:hypothetical protein